MPYIASIGTHLPRRGNHAFAKGHPRGANGVAQCVQLFGRLRGEAVNQVDGGRIGLAHNIGGLTAASAVTILEGGVGPMVCEVFPLDKSRRRESEGSPAGDTYVAQCEELFARLQREAVDQVGGARITLAQNVRHIAAVTVVELEGTGVDGG
jgi:hypothetical protein